MKISGNQVEAPVGCAFVTGGTGAVGSAVLRSLAAAGWTSGAFTYRSSSARAAALEAELAATGMQVMSVQIRQEDPVSIAGAVESAVERFGGLRLLVNAAGPHIPMVYLAEVDPADYASHLDQEVKAFFNAAHAAIPHLRRSRGSIVAVTTSATSRYAVRDGLSACTKAAVDQLVQGFAAEEGKYGVRVNAVGPGMLTDGIGARLAASQELSEDVLAQVKRLTPLRTFASAQDVADAVMFFASPEAKMLTGQKINVDAGWSV